ncbi:uncharacterized protein Z518_04264 [Rhinocladiella mackenziei CBS 650.93]|uniref:Uncharacterized protein n=1 Tax=Rhinocladiella mackenziei CBS 650.93 TaxID=1442369 RepID=A0A0D2IKP9_9EURO|nr:uncharacterized protein Z518_04264 [Rhinocladiella mackenziei CBS 650.93]KIX06289.1 hypothetical protein Z518_04264 [Rhinocladiella mackenziei CBS 650.93]
MAGVGSRDSSRGHFRATQSGAFATTFVSVTNTVFANARHVAFFGFVWNVKNPSVFPKALIALQITNTGMYFVVTMVVYVSDGDQPALGTQHMSKRTFPAVGSWLATLWVITWIIAESIPNFDDLPALISGLFASCFNPDISGIFWLFLNQGSDAKNWRRICLTIANLLLFAMDAGPCGMGLLC